MNVIKRTIIVFLALVMAIPSYINANTENFSKQLEVLTLSIGEDNGEIGYELNEDYNSGPQSFFVDGKKIYILDSVNGRILYFNNGKFKESIFIIESALDFIVYSNGYWVLGEDDKVYNYSKKGDLRGEYFLPQDVWSFMIRRLYVDANNDLIIELDNGCSYKLTEVSFELVDTDITINVEEDICTISYGNHTASLDSDDKNIGVINYDSKGNLYTYIQEYVGEASVLVFEHSIHKYDKEGNELGYAIFKKDDWIVFPNKSIFVDANDKIYVMACKEDVVIIYEIKLGNADESEMEQLNALYTQNNLGSMQSRVATANGNISLTRAQVLTRARYMAEYEFKVTAQHKIVRPGATLPKYIADAEIGETVVGIPYCWGGGYGYSTMGEYESFDSVVTGNYMAGNINTKTDGHIGETIGLDCSGFVSSAYGLSKKFSTWDFANFGTEISIDDLKYMDFLNEAGGHVVLFVSIVGNEYLVYDSGDDSGKVSCRKIDSTFFAKSKARTPWSTTCVPASGYTYSSSYHWKVCSDCGEIVTSKSAHTLTMTSNTTYHWKKCTVCGYTTAKSAHVYNSSGLCKTCGRTNNSVARLSINYEAE